MLKIIQQKASTATVNSSPSNFKYQKSVMDAWMLSEFVWGSWLSTGMRIPESFGLLPYMKHDHVYLLALFSACRLITEHIFAIQ
jgi:hypothetical protein